MGLRDRPGLLLATGALVARNRQKKKQEQQRQQYQAQSAQQQHVIQAQNQALAAQEDRELQMAIEASKREVSMRSDLPSGWEEKQDPSTGKYFYIDHVNKRTQWDKPKVLPDPSMPPAYDDCVPSTSKSEPNADGLLVKELINFGESIPPAGTYPSQLNPFNQ